MRAWGLAQGLSSHNIDVTVAINAAFPQELEESEGIHLTNWSPDKEFADLLNSFDAVITSYSMGTDSVFIADNINDDVQLILDVYVPIYVEVSARDSADMDTEYVNYMADIERFNHVLRRGDYFLCASNPQKIFYTGVLGALGVVNPRSYRQDRILVVPFGVHDVPVVSTQNPYTEQLGFKKSDFVVLWFGGLYPWFRVEELLQAIKRLSSNKSIKFVIVGGKNPFNPNPDFAKQYTYAHKYARDKGLLDTSLYFVDWVDFDTRINWFVHANLIISINNPGEENNFSWRTRVMDFVWGEAPILTNGEDVLSEELLSRQAAIRLPSLTAQAITENIQRLESDKSKLKQVVQHLREVKKDYYWHQVVSPVATIIAGSKKPCVDEKRYRATLPLDENSLAEHGNNFGATVQRRLAQANKLLRYTRKHGIRHATRTVHRRVGQRLPMLAPKRQKQYVFISPAINNTGAPLILLETIGEVTKKYGKGNIRLIAPHIDADHLRNLRAGGVRVEVARVSADNQTINLQLSLSKNDFVLINTVAVYQEYLEFVVRALEEGRLRHAFWFIHEDKSQLTPLHSALLQAKYVKRLKPLIDQKKLTLTVPAERVRRDYSQLLDTKRIEVLPYKVDVPSNLKSKRVASDYASLDFLLTGSPVDGRKGHFIAITAFYTFMKNYYEKNPKQYRNFKLHLVAIGNDFVSQQVNDLVGGTLTSRHIKLYPALPRSEALKVAHTCNAVICCSLNETFGLYVAEGMLMGHVVLRNNSAGVDEQLRDGVNGYLINEKDINQFVSVLEKILNIKTTSDKQLKDMGLASQKIIAPFTKNAYLDKLEAFSKGGADV